jgi:hypothetical protein
MGIHGNDFALKDRQGTLQSCGKPIDTGLNRMKGRSSVFRDFEILCFEDPDVAGMMGIICPDSVPVRQNGALLRLACDW